MELFEKTSEKQDFGKSARYNNEAEWIATQQSRSS
jgi:hypothetical protein